MSKIQRTPVSALLQAHPVVAVLRAGHASEYAPVIDALVKGGVRSIELTLSTDGVFDHLPGLKQEFGADAEIGVGTITCEEEAVRALERGADYLVTPAMVTDVVRVAVQSGCPRVPGRTHTHGVTRRHAGWSNRREALPGLHGGTRISRAAARSLPAHAGHPVRRYRRRRRSRLDCGGALAVSLGGPLLRDAFTGGDLAGLTARAGKLSALVAEAVQARGTR